MKWYWSTPLSEAQKEALIKAMMEKWGYSEKVARSLLDECLELSAQEREKRRVA